MSNPADIRGAIASTLSTAFGTDWNVSQYLRAKPEPPELDVFFGEVVYDTAMRAGDQEILIIIRALVQWGDDGSAQGELDPLIDWTGTATSLKAALEADRTLGGVVSALRVQHVSEMKIYQTEGGGMPGVEFTVEVWPNG